MKKLKVLLIPMFLIIFSISNVKAEGYASFQNVKAEEEILRCDYSSKDGKKTITISSKTDPDGTFKILPQVEDKNRGLLTNIVRKIDGKDESPNILSGTAVMNFVSPLISNFKCPHYIGTNSDKDEDFDFYEDATSVKTSYELVYQKFNQNNCYYRFEQLGYTFVVDKSEIEGYDGQKCPTSIFTELGISLNLTGETGNPELDYDLLKQLPYVFYPTEGTEAIVEKTLISRCETEALKNVNDVLEANNFRTDVFRPKCYKGELQETKNFDTPFRNQNIDPNKKINCSGLLDLESKEFITKAYFYIEIVAVFAVIGLTIKDYACAILNSNADELKKSNKHLLIRTIVVVAIILLPALLRFTFKVVKIEMFDSEDPLCNTVQKTATK